MDDPRFDDWTRRFASGVPRRTLLKLAAGGALGGVLRFVQGRATRAQVPCPAGQSPCNGACVASCRPGHVFDDQCRCICPLGDGTVCPNPNHIFDDCQCACPDDCLGDQVVVDPETCACACPAGTACLPNFELDPIECECICPIAECPDGQELDPDTCACVCPDVVVCTLPFVFDPVGCGCVCGAAGCAGGFELDPVTCRCFCPLGDNTVCPNPNHVFDNCACACDVDCPGDQVLIDDETCACGCPPGLTCPPNFVLDPIECECVCEIGACPGNQELDDATCRCICPLDDDDCPHPNQMLDRDQCECVCPADRACRGGQVVDPETCACVCPPGTSLCRGRCQPACPAPRVRDPRTCRCVCPPGIACPVGKVVDPVTCACVCPERRPCVRGTVRDPESCACVCPPGTTLCRSGCVPVCPPSQTLDPRTCRCSSPLYTPAGVQTGVPVSTLTGWTQCYADTYDIGAPIAGIHAACSKQKLLLACRPTGSSTLSVLAWAPRADVLFDTGQGNTPHNANNVGWYYNNGFSWGFAPQGVPISRASCDVLASSLNPAGTDGDKRLCWHTIVGNLTPGWRCGTADTLSNATYERLIFHAD